MRAFDNWNSYLDNDGNLLHGKVRFCNKGTTDNIVIYNSDEIAIRNPEFTDMLGRTEYQVFVDNVDNVTAYYYKYIGTGDMMNWPPEDYDPSRWSLQYTSDNMDPVSKIDIESNTASGAANMTEFRAVDPAEVPAVNGKKLMWLYGYYNAGDTSPVLYVWDSASQQVDDGGSCIRANDVPGAGRWKLCTRELHFDVRHYGIFPVDDINSTDYQYTSQLANCAAYLDKEGLDAWFPALNDNLSYYLYNGTNTFAIKGDIYVSDNVRMHAKTGTTGTIITCKNIHKSTKYLFDSSVQTGKITLNADWIRCSWIGYQCIPNARVGWVIDHDAYPAGITGKEVVFETNGPGQLYLTNCQITSNKKITGTIVIEDCELHTDWFADDYNWQNLTSIGNKILLENCSSPELYIQLKNKQAEVNYGDFGGATLTNVTFGSNCTAQNAKGTVTISGAATFKDCEFTLTYTGDADAMTFTDSKITFGSVTVGQLIVNGGELAGTNITAVGSRSEIHNCIINVPFDFRGGNVGIMDSVINRAMTHIGSPVNEVFKNNVFNATLTISGGSSAATVNGVWVDNYGAVSNPITFDRTNLASSDLAHTYTYRGNTGTFPPDRYYKYSAYIRWDTAIGDAKFATGAPNSEGQNWMFMPYYADTDPLPSMPNIQMFRIGTSDIQLNIRWRVVYITYPANTTYQHLENFVPIEFPLVGTFVSGFSWKPHVPAKNWEQSGNNYYPHQIGLYRLAASATWTGLSLLGEFGFSLDP